ncbi:hypothetical protein ACFWFR_00790 [Oerskovia sp. NPDC060287]|uniref:hypothetical protein n=1 Tax=Oerskovia sp. NPDC060287 TaxID=3347095 RepID=UPI00365B35FD
MSAPSPISDRAVSYLRTVVPVLWGSAVAWLLTVVVLPAEVTDLLTSDLAVTAVTALVVGAWYIAWRWAEPHIPDWLTRLALGSAQTPIYARHAKIGTLEYMPPTSGTPPPLGRNDHVAIEATGQGGTVLYVEQRADGWHYGVQLDGSNLVTMYRPIDLA